MNGVVSVACQGFLVREACVGVLVCRYCHDTYLLKKMLSSTTNMLGVLTVIIATIYGLGWRRQ